VDVSGQLHLLADWSSGKNHGIHWVGGLVCSRASLDILEKRKNNFLLPGFEPQIFNPTAYSLCLIFGLSVWHAVCVWNLMPRWSLTGQDFVLTDHLTLLTVPSVDIHRSPRFIYIQTFHINQTGLSLNTGYCLQFCIMYFPRRQIIFAVSFSLKCSQSLMESAFVVISNTERYGEIWILV
jgi:thiosulfate reductase cytochrome b subunit